MAQRYGTKVAHTRRRPSVIVMFVVCLRAHVLYNFAGLIRRTPPPTFSDTAITDRHSDTTIFQLRAHWVRIDILVSWIGKIVRTCAAGGSRTLDSLHEWRTPCPQTLLKSVFINFTVTLKLRSRSSKLYRHFSLS